MTNGRSGVIVHASRLRRTLQLIDRTQICRQPAAGKSSFRSLAADFVRCHGNTHGARSEQLMRTKGSGETSGETLCREIGRLDSGLMLV